MLKIILLFVALIFQPISNAKDFSLEEIRRALLSQEVVILDKSFGSREPMTDSLVNWYIVKGDETIGFEEIPSKNSNAPATLRGKRGFVISVEEATTSLKQKNTDETDVFGKKIDKSKTINPYIQVVVKVSDDDSLIGIRNYYRNMLGRSIQLASHSDTLKKEIEGNLLRLIGKTLYKAGYTNLLDSTLTINDLMNRNKRDSSRDYKTKNLTPMKIVDGKFLEAENSVVIKVTLPNGEARLLFGELYDYNMIYGFKPTILQRMEISAEEKIPVKFSSIELSAIKEKKIFRGMSESALYWSWGYPDKINDWGQSGEQLIYHGSQYVYINGKTVRDWQSIK